MLRRADTAGVPCNARHQSRAKLAGDEQLRVSWTTLPTRECMSHHVIVTCCAVLRPGSAALHLVTLSYLTEQLPAPHVLRLSNTPYLNS
jgi:hypothetical protein